MINPKEDHKVRFLQLCCCSSNCLVSHRINRLELDPTKTLHLLLLNLLIIKIKLLHHLLQLNNKDLLLLHFNQLLDINNSKHLLLLHLLLDISKHLLLLNRISSAQTVPDPEKDKMIVDSI